MVQGTNENEVEVKAGLRERLNAWWKNFKTTIWNGEKKEFIGRNAWSWACILLFYACYFLFTAGYFAACFSIFMKTIDGQEPTFRGYYSMLKNAPGMNFLPKPEDGSSLVSFNSSAIESYKAYVDQLEKEIETYKNQSNAHGFEVSALGDVCTLKNSFGFGDGKPCIFMRINNIYGWNPEPINASLVSGNGDSYKFKTVAIDNYIPVSCEGEGETDKKNLLEVKFFPAGGFPTKFYPYTNNGVLPPMVAAQFTVERNATVKVNCQFWTKNITFSRADLIGGLHLELFVGGSNSSSSSPSSSSTSSSTPSSERPITTVEIRTSQPISPTPPQP